MPLLRMGHIRFARGTFFEKQASLWSGNFGHCNPVSDTMTGSGHFRQLSTVSTEFAPHPIAPKVFGTAIGSRPQPGRGYASFAVSAFRLDELLFPPVHRSERSERVRPLICSGTARHSCASEQASARPEHILSPPCKLFFHPHTLAISRAGGHAGRL